VAGMALEALRKKIDHAPSFCGVTEMNCAL
jgi:hypothetical protein